MADELLGVSRDTICKDQGRGPREAGLLYDTSIGPSSYEMSTMRWEFPPAVPHVSHGVMVSAVWVTRRGAVDAPDRTDRA